jgi:hypothetical protein
MASTSETKKDGSFGGRRHGPSTEEERRQHQTELKQEFLEVYRERYGDALISAEQTWELYEVIHERWRAKMKERHRSPPHSHSPPPHHDEHPPHHSGPPHHLEEIRKQVHSELQQDFQKDFTTAHGTNKINVDQAWLLIQKVQHNKHDKLEAHRLKHGLGHRHGPEDHGRHSPPADQ